ncbi:hypothetical protein R5M92_16125 (plasmid) [Halomonas sp. Bachu 37]|uniref:hypothetical protein n=1 Tax=Halomonas kashgarensis TaxID=3084920 RepID=UPI0032176929
MLTSKRFRYCGILLFLAIFLYSTIVVSYDNKKDEHGAPYDPFYWSSGNLDVFVAFPGQPETLNFDSQFTEGKATQYSQNCDEGVTVYQVSQTKTPGLEEVRETYILEFFMEFIYKNMNGIVVDEIERNWTKTQRNLNILNYKYSYVFEGIHVFKEGKMLYVNNSVFDINTRTNTPEMEKIKESIKFFLSSITIQN